MATQLWIQSVSRSTTVVEADIAVMYSTLRGIPPQHLAVPSAIWAQELVIPTLTLTAVAPGDLPSMTNTETGTELLLVESLPNWPASFKPQHFTVPSAMTAHECLYPPTTLTAVVAGEDPSIPVTGTATTVCVVEPLPNWPLAFQPQQVAAPSTITAQK